MYSPKREIVLLCEDNLVFIYLFFVFSLKFRLTKHKIYGNISLGRCHLRM